ncbi:uncharacterized protein LOC144914979 [Branchiostoma floridae x Branchiostoma belcheri]
MLGAEPAPKRLKIGKCSQNYGDANKSRSRSQAEPLNWSLCLFCQRRKSNGIVKLVNVATFDCCKTIVKSAILKSDENLLRHIRGTDLIAAEAKYHRYCRAKYVNNLRNPSPEKETEGIYAEAYSLLAAELAPQLQSGRVIPMTCILESYHGYLEELGCPTAKSYRSERLKRRLQDDFKDKISFQKQCDPSKPELAYSLHDIVKAAVSQSEKTVANLGTPCSNARELDERSILYHASQILKSKIQNNVKGIVIQPVNVEDLTEERAKALVPEELYWFLCSLISNDENFGASCRTPASKDERQILALSQDIIFATSRGRIKMPKHVGLGVSVRHMTGSKQLVQMLNRLGHCCSYDEVEVIDTSLAMEVIAKSENYGVVIPTNISPGAFIQVAADNNDFKEETLDGKKTTHATTIVVYQKQQFGPKPKPVVHADHSEKRRSFVVDKSTDVLEFGVRKRPDVTQYKDQVKNEWFQYNTSLRSINLHKDLGWILMRMGRTLAGREGELLEDQTIPSWSAFNMIMSNEPPPQTKVGYCPLIDASSAEYSTVYTVMKQTKTMMAALGQENSVITMDLAMYVKAKTIQWCRPEEFKSTIIRLGGFHIALKYLSVIGKLFKDSGIQDVLIESEVYGPNTAQALLDGKSYNRGVRAHKLLCEALLRLQWQAFIAWLATERNEQLIESISECIEISDDEALKTSYTKLCQKMPALLQPEYEKFRRQYHERSKLFRFWDLYIEAVLLLLRFIRAEREGSWHLHLNAVAEMIPYFFALDRINYARYVHKTLIIPFVMMFL